MMSLTRWADKKYDIPSQLFLQDGADYVSTHVSEKLNSQRNLDNSRHWRLLDDIFSAGGDPWSKHYEQPMRTNPVRRDLNFGESPIRMHTESTHHIRYACRCLNISNDGRTARGHWKNCGSNYLFSCLNTVDNHRPLATFRFPSFPQFKNVHESRSPTMKLAKEDATCTRQENR